MIVGSDRGWSQRSMRVLVVAAGTTRCLRRGHQEVSVALTRALGMRPAQEVKPTFAEKKSPHGQNTVL